MSNNKKWSTDYPTHLVIPPKDSCEIDEILFRFVINTVPNENDFLPSFKDPKQKHLIRHERFKNKPGFYGTSFFKNEAAIKQIEKANPEKFSDTHVAKGQILPEHGKGESGFSEHVSMWFYSGIYPKGFKVI